ncbi:MAG: AAA family ATPase, partial [Thermomicrobiaceae bacterium]|nr:AAA family ATPase [Thermomicrobiaceae bacterium]
LAEIGASSALRLTGAQLTLCPPGPLWIDAEAFARAAAAARASGDPAGCEAALALYTGDLLPEDRYEDWAAGRREALRGEWLGLLGRLARLEEERGRYRAAIAALETLVVAEPADEAAHVGLMRLYALTGERQRALAQYGQLRTALHRDLDTEPDPATERLYRAVLRGEFPPLGTVPAAEPSPPSKPGGNLPTLLTSFVDRERERAELKALLGPGGPSRLVTLIGPAGAGKTRLAVAAAAEQSAEFPGGAWFVGLAPLTSGEAIPSEIARALGVREPTDVDLVEALVVALRGRPTLLVLDNCEHLIEPAARLALLLLRRVPDLRVLATSREALHA